MTIALLGRIELRPVGMKREGGARHFLVLLWNLNLYEAEGAARIFFRRSDAQEQLIACG